MPAEAVDGGRPLQVSQRDQKPIRLTQGDEEVLVAFAPVIKGPVALALEANQLTPIAGLFPGFGECRNLLVPRRCVRSLLST